MEDSDYEHNRIVLYPVLIAMAVLVAIVIVVVAVWQRYGSISRQWQYLHLFHVWISLHWSCLSEWGIYIKNLPRLHTVISIVVHDCTPMC